MIAFRLYLFHLKKKNVYIFLQLIHYLTIPDQINNWYIIYIYIRMFTQ